MRTAIPIAIAALLLVPTPAAASPWTLGRGQLVVASGLDHQYAEREYLRGAARAFPLRGSYQSTNYRLALRLGLTDRDEIELSLPFRQVNYESDPVLLLAHDPDSELGAFDYYQRNVIDLSRTQSGIGDLELAARHAWLKRSFALASELRLKTPTGYDPPSGTFGDRPRDTEEFLADAARFVSPQNVEDDVTLGDGQLDLSLLLLAGYGAPSGTFVRADVGYALRLGGAADQLLSALKVGQKIGERLLVYVDGRAVIALQRGRVIGISVVAEDPSLPAQQYEGLSNLQLREQRLERDAVDAGGGLLYRVRPDVELYGGYSQTLWGRNTALVHTIYTGVSVRAEI